MQQRSRISRNGHWRACPAWSRGHPANRGPQAKKEKAKKKSHQIWASWEVLADWRLVPCGKLAEGLCPHCLEWPILAAVTFAPEDEQEPAKHIGQEHPRLPARVSSVATTLTDPLACASSLYALARLPYKHAARASGSSLSLASFPVLNGPTRSALRACTRSAGRVPHTSPQREQVDPAFWAPRVGSLTDPLACASSLYELPRPPIQARSASKWIRRFGPGFAAAKPHMECGNLFPLSGLQPPANTPVRAFPISQLRSAISDTLRPRARNRNRLCISLYSLCFLLFILFFVFMLASIVTQFRRGEPRNTRNTRKVGKDNARPAGGAFTVSARRSTAPARFRRRRSAPYGHLTPWPPHIPRAFPRCFTRGDNIWSWIQTAAK